MKIEEYLKRASKLPPTPTVAMQLLQLFNEPDRDVDRIVELVSVDAGLTAETLRRCNSVQFAGATPVGEMFEAVTRLGVYEIYCLVTGLMASRTMLPVLARYRKQGEDYWEHTVAAAVLAGVLARHTEESEPCAFTAGLLHDVGKLVLVSVDGVSYARALIDTGGHGQRLNAVEEQAYEFNHAELGSRLMWRWGMPAAINLAVQHHHHTYPLESPHGPFVAVVAAANALAHRLQEQSANTAEEDANAVDAVSQLGLTEAEVNTLVETGREELARFRALLKSRN